MIKIIHNSDGTFTVNSGEYNSEELAFILRSTLAKRNINSKEIYGEELEDIDSDIDKIDMMGFISDMESFK